MLRAKHAEHRRCFRGLGTPSGVGAAKFGIRCQSRSRVDRFRAQIASTYLYLGPPTGNPKRG